MYLVTAHVVDDSPLVARFPGVPVLLAVYPDSHCSQAATRKRHGAFRSAAVRATVTAAAAAAAAATAPTPTPTATAIATTIPTSISIDNNKTVAATAATATTAIATATTTSHAKKKVHAANVTRSTTLNSHLHRLSLPELPQFQSTPYKPSPTQGSDMHLFPYAEILLYTGKKTKSTRQFRCVNPETGGGGGGGVLMPCMAVVVSRKGKHC